MKNTKYTVNPDNRFSFEGFLEENIRFIEDFQLKDKALWKRFSDQFKIHSDDDNGWRGEYWGKMMRGACYVYSYTQDSELYDTLSQSVKDLLLAKDEDGILRSYPKDKEFGSWDLWCRKYVILGLEYYLEICADAKLKKEIIETLKVQADYIAEFFENGKGDKKITKFGAYSGINSSSVLEPFVRLYEITGEEKYLDFSKYIVDCGGTSIGNIFEFAYENVLPPYQYPITKAYEMISCFEGLLRLYNLEKDEKHKTILINFADRLLETDFTIIGASCCSHEFFDHSTVRQANPGYGKSMQETCVTVTLMKFLLQMAATFGDPKYVDAFECSMYNAYLGAINTEKSINYNVARIKRHPDAIIEPLPFDSYSPITPGVRGISIGGLKLMPDNHYYGCCACIGSVGIGMFHKMMCMSYEDGIVINLYNKGVAKTFTPSGKNLELSFDTEYPKFGEVTISILLSEKEEFGITLRNPAWSKVTKFFVNGNEITAKDGYTETKRCWENGDVITAQFDMSFNVVYPIPYGMDMLFTRATLEYTSHFIDYEDETAKNHVAIKRGPIVMAVDSRLGRDATSPIPVKIVNDEIIAEISSDNVSPYKNIVEIKVEAEDGAFYMTDYASAGKTWSKDSDMATWFLRK